jgi:hypothetical protein
MVTFTRDVPILLYEPWALTTSSPAMAGTVKLCVPELAFVGELGACGELVGCADAVSVTDGVAECLWVGDVDGDWGDVDGSVAEDDGVPVVGAAAAELSEAVDGFDPLAPQAVRPAPAMTAAMIRTATRHVLIPLPLR